MNPAERGLYIELLTPKQDTDDIPSALDRFAARYRAILDAGWVVSIPDNPMGIPRFQAIEVIEELGLPDPPDQVLIHLNTFHTRADLDKLLTTAQQMGLRRLLVVSGDGSQRLPKLTPAALGVGTETVTSVELLRHIERSFHAAFGCGVAFNPYEPPDHEQEKMKRKLDAGAQFAITQPVIGANARVAALCRCGIPVVPGAWMSTNLGLLANCVGAEFRAPAAYDPRENLRGLLEAYPACGLYLSLLRFDTQLADLPAILGRASLRA